MANSINYTTRKANGAEVTKNISNVNPLAADSDVAVFVAHVAGLSDNTLTAIEKVETDDVVIVPDNVIYAESRAVSIINSDFEQIHTGEYNDVVRNSLDAVTIVTGAGDDTIENIGDSVSIACGNGHDSILNTGDSVTISAKGTFNYSGAKTITNSGASCSIIVNDSCTDYDSDTKIYTYSSVSNSGNNVSIQSSNFYTPFCTNTGDSVYCNYGRVTNSGDHVTLDNAYYFNNSGDYCSLKARESNLYLNTGQHCTLFSTHSFAKNATIDTTAHGYQFIGLKEYSSRGNYSLCTAEGNNTIAIFDKSKATLNFYGFNQNSDLLILRDTPTVTAIENGTKITTYYSRGRVTFETNLYGVTSGTVRYIPFVSATGFDYDLTAPVQLLNLNPENENSAMPDDENLFIADI